MPFSVLRLGIDARLGVDHVGAVRLTGDSAPARFAGRAAVSCSLSLTRGVRLSVKLRKKNSEFWLFSDFE